MSGKDTAETTALLALRWLATNEDLFPTFLAATGASVSDVAQSAARPEFLASVLDFVLSEDQWVIAMAAWAEIRPESLMQARAALPGGQAIHWT